LLLLCGTMTIALASFFGLRGARAQALLVAALASVIAACLFLISALDHPIAGDLAIRPEAFDSALTSMDHTDRM